MIDKVFLGNSSEDEAACRRRFPRFPVDSGCVVELETGELDNLNGEVLDCSDGGIGIEYSGRGIKKGDVLLLSSVGLGVVRKEGEVMWSAPAGASSTRVGVRWN